MFLFGVGAVPAVTFALQAGMGYLLNLSAVHSVLTAEAVLGDHELMATVAAPLTEEVMKVAPLFLLLTWGRQSAWRRISGPIDCAVLAGASGAGFAFTENVLRVAAQFWGELGPDRVIPVASPSLGPVYLFPEMVGSRDYGVNTVWFGHGEITAAVGLAVGLGLWARWRHRRWWLIPGIALLWAIWDHFLVNYVEPNPPSQIWVRLLLNIDLQGRLLPFVFLAALLFAVWVTSKTQRWYLSLDRAAALERIPFALARPLMANPNMLARRIRALYRFWHVRRSVGWGFYTFSQSRPERAVLWAAWLAALRDRMLAEKRILLGIG